MIKRREFFTGMAGGILGLGMGKPATQEDAEDTVRIRKYNRFGKTGLKVSDVSFGATNIFSPDVVRYALDLGVNLFDTAEGYMDGHSEEIVGEGIRGVRDKAIVVTKQKYRRPDFTRKDVVARMEASLKRLGTDYVDIAYIHGLHDMSLLKNEEILAGYEQLKKDGKVRFTGFSTHNAAHTLEECVKPEYAGFVQAVLFIYNHMEKTAIEPLMKKVHEAGIGTVAMKSQAGGRQGRLKSFVSEKESYETAAIKWVLANGSVDSCVIAMTTFSHVEEYLGASGRKLGGKDRACLERYREEADRLFCRLSCNECEPACPQNVAISDVMRYAMYFEDYGHQRNAIHYYARLDDARKPVGCEDCAAAPCQAACPFGLEVRSRLLRTHAHLTV